jgi:hypothetical protein
MASQNIGWCKRFHSLASRVKTRLRFLEVFIKENTLAFYHLILLVSGYRVRVNDKALVIEEHLIDSNAEK